MCCVYMWFFANISCSMSALGLASVLWNVLVQGVDVKEEVVENTVVLAQSSQPHWSGWYYDLSADTSTYPSCSYPVANLCKQCD